MKILIIEDEVALATSIQHYLKSEGNSCDIATTFNLACMKIGAYQYDCVLVDITLPDGNGLAIVKQLKSAQNTAGVIIISAKHSLEDKVSGLDLGADDYLSKPFHLSELNARIKALVRRREFDGNTVVTFREIQLWPHEKRVKVNEQEVTLTRSEYQLLTYFLANPNRVLSKEGIGEQLVGDSADLLDSLDFVYSHVKNLRRKLIQAGAGDYLKAVYGVGYKFSDR
jgi:DNA-binding response OmpR family regulator